MVQRLKMNSELLLSKMATSNGHGEDSPYFDGWKAYDKDPYHPEHNPNGIIQMGLAENQLGFDIVEDWVRKNPQASICTAEGIEEFRETAIFQDYYGLAEFRNAVAKFMAKVRGNRVTFNPEKIVMSAGATGAHEMIAFCLANPGEAILVPTPYYPGFDRDLKWRTGVQLVPVVCESCNDFNVTMEAIECAYESAEFNNITVKGLLVTNPSNPLGTVLDGGTLRSIVRFVNEKNIHLVCDEIYAATIFKDPEFISISEIIEEDAECNLDLIHIVYSLSKDMGFPGFRVGIVYSYNDGVVNCARKMSSFGLVSSQTQYLIAAMLSDEEFVEKFIAENRKQLAARNKFFTRGLAQVGIRCLKTSNAGLYVWMDLRHLLEDQTFRAEIVLWRVIISDVKLNVSPGSSFHCSEPGWFRACFANMRHHTMEVALSRIRAFVLQSKEGCLKPRRKLCWQSSLKLSFSSSRIYEDFVLSPHSPMSSPLVHAKT